METPPRYNAPNQIPDRMPPPPKQAPSYGGNERLPTVEIRRAGGSAPAVIRPFKLSVALVDDEYQWKVSSQISSITDGTNGDAIDLTLAGLDASTPISATKHIVLEADVTAGVVSGWTLVANDAANAKEIGTDAGPPITQNKVRLRIGKVVFDMDDVATAEQYVESCQILTDMFLNGMIAKGFESHPYNNG